jgi:hypothetical protein
MCFRGAAVALSPVQQFRSNDFAPPTQDKRTKVDPTWVEAIFPPQDFTTTPERYSGKHRQVAGTIEGELQDNS